MSTTGDNRTEALWAELGFPDTAKTLPADALIGGATVHPAKITTRPDALERLNRSLQGLPPLDISDDVTSSADLLTLDELGRGGMGVVSRAEQRSLGRDVAVKRALVGKGATSVRLALVDEARVLGRLQHPNIVPVYALGTDGEGAPVLVMKRIEGALWAEMLHDLEHPRWRDIDDDPLEWHLDVLLQICRAIEYAHSVGLIHRDLKPANVMVGDFGEVYVLDWGVACAVDDTVDSPLGGGDGERSAALVGTPCYMAPEMLRRGRVTVQTDVFLLGGVLHEILTGSPPHAGDNLFAVLFAVAAAEPRTYPSHVPEGFIAICERALAPHPGDRFESVQAFREALAAALRHRVSAKLASDATACLERTPAEGDAEVWRHLWESRFGFREALAMWPANAVARDGLNACLSRMVEQAVAARDVKMAVSLLDELGADAEEELETAVQRLRDSIASDSAQVAKLRGVAKHHDVEMRQALRGRQLLWMCGANAALGVATIVALHVFHFEATYSVALVIGALPPPIVLFFRWQSRQRHSPVSARLLNAFFVMTVAAMLIRVIGWRMDVPLHATIAFELATDCLAAAVTSILVDRRLRGPAVLCALCLALTLVVPEQSLTLLLIGVTVGLTWAGLLWSRG